MKLSHSRVSTHVKCPYQYKLRYIDKLRTLPTDDSQSPLILGHAMHTGIEHDVQAAIDEYYNAYPVINDMHITEAMKLQYWLPKIKEVLPVGEHEIKIEDDDFIGYIDLLTYVTPEVLKQNAIDDSNNRYEWYDLYDFKYSNSITSYMNSEQLHLYKYYFEKLNPTKRIRNMYFMFVPKSNLRLKRKNKTNKKDETIEELRKRIYEDLDKKQIEFVKIDFDVYKVVDFLINGKHVIEATEFEKKPSRLCDWCEYQRYCEKGEDIDMQLPENKREVSSDVVKRKIWIYGSPFAGKTCLANQFPSMLLLSTDGNYRQLPDGIPPHIDIKDIVNSEGRITKRQFAWDVFKESITELEKKQNDFKTIVVDLVEDTYEHCRLYMYDKLGIEHESDDSFRAWDKVRTEFLSTIKKLMNLDYENIIMISHEDSSKDLTKKSGDKITSIKPNLQDKAALKLSGMVDVVARVISDDDKRVLSFKTSEVIFGGGRLNVQVNEIPCDFDELMKVYDEANVGAVKTKVFDTPESIFTQETIAQKPLETPEKTPRKARNKVEEVGHEEESFDTVNEDVNEDTASDDKPKTRVRKTREKVEEKVQVEPVPLDELEEPEIKEEQPTRRRRKRGA